MWKETESLMIRIIIYSFAYKHHIKKGKYFMHLTLYAGTKVWIQAYLEKSSLAPPETRCCVRSNGFRSKDQRKECHSSKEIFTMTSFLRGDSILSLEEKYHNKTCRRQP